MQTLPVFSPQCVPWWEATVGGQGFCWALRAAAASAGLQRGRSTTWDLPQPEGSRWRAGWLSRNTGVWLLPARHAKKRNLRLCTERKSTWFYSENVRGWTWPYHDADVVSVVQRQGSVHLQQVVLRPEKTLQVLWMETHHEGNVIQAAEGCKRILKYRLSPGVHFTDLEDLVKEDINKSADSSLNFIFEVWSEVTVRLIPLFQG